MNVSKTPTLNAAQDNRLPSLNSSRIEANSGNAISKMASTVMQSQPIQTAANIKNFVVNLVTDLLSIVVQLIKKVVHFLRNTIHSFTNGQGKLVSVGFHSASVDKTKGLVLEELSDKFLNETFDKIEKVGLNSPEISKEIFQLAEDPKFWRRWAIQLKLPHNSSDNPKENVIKLLCFFKINPKTRQATILKNLDNVKDALLIYPNHAYLIRSIPGSTGFNFYCRQPNGSYTAYENVDSENLFSESTIVTNDIVTDKSYTILSMV